MNSHNEHQAQDQAQDQGEDHALSDYRAGRGCDPFAEDGGRRTGLVSTRAELITGRVATGGYEQTLRAGVRLLCTPLLLRKISEFVEPDGWVDWVRLAHVLATGCPWSGGEQRLARLACSLSGQLAYLDLELSDDAVHVWDLHRWSLAECLTGLDDANRAAVLDAVHYAATGQPMSGSAGSSGGETR